MSTTNRDYIEDRYESIDSFIEEGDYQRAYDLAVYLRDYMHDYTAPHRVADRVREILIDKYKSAFRDEHGLGYRDWVCGEGGEGHISNEYAILWTSLH